VGKAANHAGQTTLCLTPVHGKTGTGGSKSWSSVLARLCGMFGQLRSCSTGWTAGRRCCGYIC